MQSPTLRWPQPLCARRSMFRSLKSRRGSMTENDIIRSVLWKRALASNTFIGTEIQCNLSRSFTLSWCPFALFFLWVDYEWGQPIWMLHSALVKHDICAALYEALFRLRCYSMQAIRLYIVQTGNGAAKTSDNRRKVSVSVGRESPSDTYNAYISNKYEDSIHYTTLNSVRNSCNVS